MNLRVFLATVLVCFGLTANAAQVLKVKGSKVLIALAQMNVQEGDALKVLSSFGEQVAEIRVTKVKNDKALADVTRGTPLAGQYIVKAQSNLDGESRLDGESSLKQSSKKYNIRLQTDGAGAEYLLTSWYSLGLSAHYAIASATDNSVSVTGSIAAGAITNTFYFSSQGYEDSWYGGLDLGYGVINVTKSPSGAAALTGSTSGFYSKVALGYHWKWESFNLYLGFGVMRLGVKSITLTNGTTSETYNNPPSSSSGADLKIAWAF